MRGLRWAGLALLAIGLALLAASLAGGEGRVHLVLFIPVIEGGGVLGLLGIVALSVGLFLTMAGPFWGTLGGAGRTPATVPPSVVAGEPPSPGPPAPRYGGVVMIGPIPIAFGSDASIAKWMLVLGIALFALALAGFLVFTALR